MRRKVEIYLDGAVIDHLDVMAKDDDRSRQKFLERRLGKIVEDDKFERNNREQELAPKEG